MSNAGMNRTVDNGVNDAVTGSVHPGLRDFIDEVGMSR